MSNPELGTVDFWERLRVNPSDLAREVCTIDVINLDQTLQEQPALRAWVNAAFEVARIAEERCKWDVTRTRALALLAGKKKKDPDTEKPKTVSVLEAEVDTNPSVEEAMTKLHAQQDVTGGLRAMTKALDDRKDMLVQISAKQRKEREDYQ